MAVKVKPRPKPMKPTRHVGANGAVSISTTEVLTLDQAAGFLQLPVETVKSEAVAGRLPGRMIGREWRFSHSGLLLWLTPPIRSPFGNILDYPVSDETPEEQEVFMTRLREIRAEWNAGPSESREQVP